MQLLRRILCTLALAAAPSAHATGVVVVSGGGSGFWLALAIWASFLPPPAPPAISPHHLGAAPTPATRDACTWVAGVRHCPLPELRPSPSGEPR